MLVRVLGSLEVDTGWPARVTGATQRRLLCALTLHAGNVVPADRLADRLGLSDGGLRTAVSRLRRVLGPVLVTEPPGYGLRGVQVDAEIFEALLGQARVHVSDPSARLLGLDEALGWWRGDPYPDVADLGWAQPDVVRLTELWAGAVEDRAEALVGLGRYAEAVADLEAHRANHRLRDRPCALLMRALAAQGRQSEALRVYQGHRRNLGDEVGTEPSAELVELEHRIAAGWHDTLPTASPSPTGTVTFLFTDIEGSTKLWDQRAAEMDGAIVTHDRIVGSAIKSNRGYVFSHPGDGFAAAFARADDALAAAVDAQLRLNGDEWAGAPLRVRMALHTGVAQERDGNYFGPTLNQAARLMAIGHGGQILVSSVTSALLDPSTDLLDLGHHRLKDLLGQLGVWQLRHPGLPVSFPPLRSSGATGTRTASRLPMPAHDLVGRRDELRLVHDLLRAHRFVTLTGTGGVGKTRLALAVAAQALPDFRDGVWWFDLTPLTSSSDLLATIAAPFSVRPLPGQSLLDGLIESLADRRAALVLDNCEHLLTAAASFTGALLRECPAVVVLATSREPVGIASEVVYAVPPLDAGSDGAELFMQRARAADVSFRSDVHREAVVELCRRLDGLPLAIELAAARVRAFSPADLHARLHDGLQVLRSTARDGSDRHRTLVNTLDWSYGLLDVESRQLFDRLAAFSGTFDLTAMLAVCSDGSAMTGDPPPEVNLLAGLVDKSMVVATHGGEGTRYRLLETMRQYAADHLDSATTWTHHRRHLDHYIAVAEMAERSWVADFVSGRQIFEQEWDNIRAAVGWAIDVGDSSALAHLFAAVTPHAQWMVRSEVYDWAVQAVALPDAGPSAFGSAAILAGLDSRIDEADRLGRQGIALASSRADRSTRDCWMAVFVARSLSGDVPGALAAARSCLEALTASWGDFGEAIFSSILANLELHDDPAAALARCTRAEEIVSATGNPLLRSDVLSRLARYQSQLGEHELALSYCAEALHVATVNDIPLSRSMARNALVRVGARGGDRDLAPSLLEAISESYRDRLWFDVWTSVAALGAFWSATDQIDDACVVVGFLEAHGIRPPSDLAGLVGTSSPTEHEWRGARMSREEVITFICERLEALIASTPEPR